MSVQCNKCEDSLIAEDSVRCYGPCQGHYHFACAAVKEIQYRNRTQAKKEEFRCQSCRPEKEKKTAATGTPAVTPTGTPSLDDLHALMIQVNTNTAGLPEEVREIQKEIQDIKKSQQYLSECYDTMLTAMKEIESLKAELKEVKEELASRDRVIHQLYNREAKSEQYSRRVHLEFNGISEVVTDNKLEETLVKVAAEVGVALEPSDIEVCHRLPSRESKQVRTVIAEFNSRRKRDELLSRRYAEVILNKKVTGSAREEGRIYINESLSPYYKHLLWATKCVAKEKQYKYCWFRRDRVLVKKDDKEKVIVIEDEKDTLKIK